MEQKSVHRQTPSQTFSAAYRLSLPDQTGIKNTAPKLFSKPTLLDRWLVKKMLEVVGNPPIRIGLWDGNEVTPPCKRPVAIMTYRDRVALLKSLIDPELHWGDLYCSSRVEFEGDMLEFMQAVYLGISSKTSTSWLRKLALWVGHRRIFNSPEKAKENINHHYDIGNDFYKLWLDKAYMQYTCAYFPEPDMELEDAQIAKLHHICRKLNLQPGDKVVEAGCGWGGLARFMAEHYGVHVSAYNISEEQVNYARQRASLEGLSDRVEYILDDYRNIKGQYDVFVSVGMLEHVAIADYEQLGRVIKGCLKADGRGLIHSIGRIIPGPINAWIERRIFPGARPPTLSEMMPIFEANALATYDIENLRLHYSKTLQAWAQRFEQQKDEIAGLMGDDFVRAWGLYLYGSLAAFNVGELQLFQVVFGHVSNNKIPWSRDYMYQPQRKRSGDKTRLKLVPSKSK